MLLLLLVFLLKNELQNNKKNKQTNQISYHDETVTAEIDFMLFQMSVVLGADGYLFAIKDREKS